VHKIIISVLVLSALRCSPTLHPLYLDYQHNEHVIIPRDQIELALQEAGWTVTVSPSDNSVTTANREIRNWLFYKVVVYVETIPISQRHVRLLVHPYRVYITGSRSKIPFLKSGIRRSVTKEITQVFQSYGLTAVDPDWQ